MHAGLTQLAIRLVKARARRVGGRLLVPRQATFALLTIWPRRRSQALRFRQAI
jgi:hypothetical protein